MASQFGSTTYGNIMSNESARRAFQEEEKTYAAFSGADIVAYMGHKRVANLQGITYSVTREVAPVFVMGDPSPKAFTKGKRAIAGNLVFTQFDKHAILRMAKLVGQNVNFVGDMDYFNVPANYTLNGSPNTTRNAQISPANFAALAGFGTSTPGNRVNLNSGDEIADAINKELQQTYALVATRRFKYSDQVPPFDVTITMVNEIGQVAYMAIHDIQLVNEGGGYTLDDLNSEVAFTFVARGITPLDTVIGGDGTREGVTFNDNAGARYAR